MIEKITFTLSSTLLDQIDKKVGNQYDNRSEALRNIIEKGLKYEDQINDYEARINTLESKLDEKDKMIKEANKRKDQSSEIVERTEGFMKYLEEKKKAGLFTRIKWGLFGYNPKKSEENKE